MANPHRADAARMLDDRGYTGHLIRGQPPHTLIESAVRDRITTSYYWKEQCFGLNAATLCDRAAALTYVGGTYSAGRRASPFLCLAFKMLQLGVEDDIVEEYLAQDEFKYLRALAAFYVRLTSERSEEVYVRLERFLRDGRKLRVRGNNSGFRLSFVDEFVDGLLAGERVCATSFWKLVPRGQLEDEERLGEYVSPVAHLLESEGSAGESDKSRSRSGSRSGSESTYRRSRWRRSQSRSQSGRSHNDSDRRRWGRDDSMDEMSDGVGSPKGIVNGLAD